MHVLEWIQFLSEEPVVAVFAIPMILGGAYAVTGWVYGWLGYPKK